MTPSNIGGVKSLNNNIFIFIVKVVLKNKL